MIDKATVRKILDTADIVEVVSDYVHLTRRGSNYMGLCPFHNERTPSFSVSPSRGICHCFSCGKGGSPVNFIMEKEGINYHDALLHLASKYGIKVEERELTDEERERQSLRESMLVANEWAMNRFRENMRATQEGRDVGLQYFYQRGLTQEAIEKFKLGYALDRSTDLYEAAMRQGFDLDTLRAVGLCGIGGRDNRPYDRFRGRVIFPILNSAGKVIAFGGRGIKGEAAKYINSPESPVYNKSNELYGIFQAKNAIVRHKKCFLVEGYMDVIGMWQSGLENVVASSGTSLTDGQIALLHRFTEDVTLIYDGDAAGIKASLRGIDLLLSHNLDIKILLLPDGDDPDSFARKHTPEEFRAYVAANEVDFITFKTRTLLSGNENNPSARAQAVSSIVESLACISDLIKRTLYIQQCSHMMNLPENILTAEVANVRSQAAIKLRQQRDRNRIETDSTVQPVTEAAQDVGKAAPAATVVTPRIDPLLEEVEKNAIGYIVKYGMTDFCQRFDENDEPAGWVKAVEFIKEELSYDNISFSNPLYLDTFNRVLQLIGPFEEDARHATENIRQTLSAEHEAWVRELTTRSISMQELEDAENDYRNKETEKLHSLQHEFAASYIGKTLGSDPNDGIRRLVLELITPRYTLSKYHSKNVHIETEAERLTELVPRAICEWKDAILALRYRRTQSELKEATTLGDIPRSEQLIADLKNIADLRREIAKSIGERILSPKR